MTLESLERIRFFVSQTRIEFLTAANNSRLNGYKEVAALSENKAQLAQLILDDLAREHA